jgi:integrase
MTRKVRLPSYRLHKSSGQAVVVLNGRSIYLGRWNSAASRSEYARVLAEWLTHGHCLAGPSPQAGPAGSLGCSTSLLINEVLLSFWTHARQHYRYPDGRPTRELDNLRDALRPVRKLYGHTAARDFGALALRAVQQEMVKSGLCRTVVNDRIKRVRRFFRWAASVELIPAAIVHALESVPPLKRGRCDARESAGVRPLDWRHVDAVLPTLPRPVAAMVQIMRFSNCRAEDAVILRGCDLTMAGDVWEFRPAAHKNLWREPDSPTHKRIVFLGPQCQEVIRPFLKADPQHYLFSAKESRAEYEAQRASQRKTKRTPSELRRRRTAKCPKRKPGNKFSVNSFQQCIRRACRRAGVPVWTLLQIRHMRATEVRQDYGLEGAAASLGDSVEAAEIYAARNQELARRIAREIG